MTKFIARNLVLKHIDDTAKNIANAIDTINAYKDKTKGLQDKYLLEDMADKGILYLFTLSKIRELDDSKKQMVIAEGILNDMNYFSTLISNQFVSR